MKKLACTIFALGAIAFFASNFRSADAIPRQPDNFISHQGKAIAHIYDDFSPIKQALEIQQKQIEEANQHHIFPPKDRVMVDGKYLFEIPYFYTEPGSIKVKRSVDEKGKPTRDLVVSYNSKGGQGFFTIADAYNKKGELDIDGFYFPAGEEPDWHPSGQKRARFVIHKKGEGTYVVFTKNPEIEEMSRVIQEIRGAEGRAIAKN